MTTAQRVAIVPLDRDLVFDTDLRRIFVGDGSTLGGLSLSTDGLGMTWHGAYAGGHSYVVNDIVSYNGSTYICILASTGNIPTNVTYWGVLAQGIDTSGFLDKATYDPTTVNGDAFDMDNMVEGTNNKLVSATEKTNFHAPGSDNQDLSGLMVKASNLSDVVNVTTARNNILPSKTSNALKVLRVNSGETDYELATMSGGDVVGPTSSTDNAVARFDLATGKAIQDSAVTIADTTGDITGGKYNTVAISGSSTPALSVSGTASISGSNTGDNSPNTSIAATKLDDFATPDDNTDLNANTTNHGLLLKATQPASTFINVVAIGNGETSYTNKGLFDSTDPSTQAYGDLAATGSATVAARRDHKHAMPAAPTGGTPAITLGIANTAGSSSNFLRVDDTVLAFDATNPSTQVFGDAAVVGVATVAARRDHKHAMPASTKDTTAATGILKGNGSTISAATAGTDYSIGSTGLAGGQTIAGGTLTTQSLSLRPNAADLNTGAVAALGTLEASSSTVGSVTVAGGLAVNKRVWATDMTVTNAITGSVTGNAGTVTNATLTTALTVNTGTVTLVGNAANTSSLTLGAGAISLSGSSTPALTVTGTSSISGTNTGDMHTPTAIWGDCVQASSVVAGTVSYVRVPYGGTIRSWSLVATVASTATFDIWKLNAALPTVTNTITASAKPSLTTATTNFSATLTGWTTAVTAGDVFGFRLDTLTSGTPTSITLVLNVG
jgi:hypothetical protein